MTELLRGANSLLLRFSCRSATQLWRLLLDPRFVVVGHVRSVNFPNSTSISSFMYILQSAPALARILR